MMRKSSKAVSLLLAGLMATSCFSMAAVSASAATADSEETGAVMTLDQRIAAGHQVVLFEFPDAVWGDYTKVKWNAKKHTVNVFCNYYAIYGNQNEVETRSWEAPSTSMYADTNASKTFYFDITESGQGEMEEGAEYGILFSTKANAGTASLLQPNTDGFQTCDLYFNTKCLGSTFKVDEPAVTRENTANSQKIDYSAHNDNGISAPLKKVSTLCAYIDGMHPGTTPNGLEMANALKSYLPNPVNEPSFTWSRIQPMLSQFNTTAQEVYDCYVEKYGAKVEAGTLYEHQDGVDDLKPDGTLKDVYRYSYIVTDAGLPTEKTDKYPTLDLVKERLNLSDEPPVPDTPIDTVTVSLNNAVVAPGEAIPTAVAPSGGNYTAVAEWQTTDAAFGYDSSYALTVTYTANDGYVFEDVTSYDLSEVGEGSVSYTTATDYVDGNFVVTYTFTTGSEPIPTPDAVYTVVGDEAEIYGISWDPTAEDNDMTFNDQTGKFEKSYTVTKAYNVVQLKVVKDRAEYLGDKDGNNLAFGLTGPGTFTVVFTPGDPEVPDSHDIQIVGDIVTPVAFTYTEVYAAGNGEGNYLNGASWDPGYIGNLMEEVEKDVWEITFLDVPDGFERQIKFALDGSWTYNFGFSKDPDAVFEPGVAQEAGWDGSNITFDTDDYCDITARLDLRNFDFATKSGATYTITIEYKGEDDDFVGKIGDVDGDGEITIADATLIQRRGIELENFTALQDALADVNNDGRISILDVTCVQKYLAERTDGTGDTGYGLKADGTRVPANS